MHIEDSGTAVKADKELPILDLDDMEETELSNDKDLDTVEMRPNKNKGERFKVRRSIEDILEERALRRQLSDVFDEDILLD